MASNKNIETANLISLDEALKSCDSTNSCGFCKYCIGKVQIRYVIRKDGVKSFWPWSGSCHRYPPTVVMKNNEAIFVNPRVYLTNTCGEFAPIESKD